MSALADRSPELLAKAGLVAAALGEGWHHEEHDPGYAAAVVHPDGRRLILNLTWAHGRLTVAGIFGSELTEHRPYSAGGGRVQHRITLAPTRPAEDVAQAIRRRLLPAYSTELEQARARKREAEATSRDALSTAREVAKRIGGDPPHDVAERHEFKVAAFHPLANLAVSVYTYGGGVVEIRCKDNAALLAVAAQLRDVLLP